MMSMACLRIDTFVNYRQPVAPHTIYNPIFKYIKNEKLRILILDLRNNGGGSTDASQGLLANLITQKIPYKLDMYVNTLEFDDLRPHLSSWDEYALNPWRIAFSKNDNGSYSLRSWFTHDLDIVMPAKYAFDGKIIALTSNNNSSGSTNLLSVIHSTGRATLVGEKTGGSAEGPTAGVLFTLKLPESKITTRIPFFQYKNNVNSFTKGMGMLPDIEAPMTVKAFLASKDPAFEAALYLDKRGSIAELQCLASAAC
jgi:C-terminal processing protease CtpA/Prc